MIYPDISIVIVNLNGLKHLKRCFKSLSEQTYPKTKVEIYLVDNSSVDKSVSWVKRKYPKVKVIKNDSNLGFAISNNLAISKTIKETNSKYIVTLNNDTVVTASWLTTLVKYMESNPNCGVAVGKILMLKRERRIDSTGDFFSSTTYRVINRGVDEIDKGQYSKDEEVLTACAAGAIFRIMALKETKIDEDYFDSDFISYLEDVDLCTRMKLAGWACMYVANAVMYHLGSATSSKLSNKYREFYSRRNRVLFSIKNFDLKHSLFLIYKYVSPSAKGLVYYSTDSTTYKHSEENFNKLTFVQAMLVHAKAILSALLLTPKMYRKRVLIKKIRKVDDTEIERWFRELSI